jgi:hypothetical protein
MPATFDKILGKPLSHKHQTTDITGLTNLINSSNDTIATINSTQVLTSISANVELVDATSANISVTLPAISTLSAVTFRIKKIDSSNHTVTIIPNGTDKIENISQNLIIEFANTSAQLIASTSTSSWFII